MPQAKKKTVKQAANEAVRNRSAAQVVQPGANIVASMADDFKRNLLKIVDKGLPELTIDFANVEIIDSIGLGVVIATHNSLSNRGGKLRVINVSDYIYQLFITMRLDQHFEVKQAAA